MIDTDDYEGHTPGPWEWYDDDIIEAHGDRSSIARMEYHYKKKDAILITDAPLLLAEVKRLQKRSKKLENALLTLADGAGDVPMFNKGGEAYEALWGEEE